MTEDEIERARREGEQWGQLKQKIESLESRMDGQESQQRSMRYAVLAVVGSILTSWAKMVGLL